MPVTFVKIQTVDITSSGTVNIQFSSIPSTYTDLMVVMVTRTTRAGVDVDDEMRVEFNSDTTTSNYGTIMVEGNGSTARSAKDTGIGYIGRLQTTTDNAAGSFFGGTNYYLANYRNTSLSKTLWGETTAEANATSVAYQSIVAGTWANSSAITNIRMFAIGTFDQYSGAILYGITKA